MPLYKHRFAGAEHPNHTWCAEFKGWICTDCGERCDPLAISDAHSRYLLCCQIATRTDTVHIEACDPHRQRRTLCQQGSEVLEPAIVAVGTVSHPRGAEQSRFSAGQWTSRTHASHFEAGNSETAGAQSAAAKSEVPQLSTASQRGSSV